LQIAIKGGGGREEGLSSIKEYRQELLLPDRCRKDFTREEKGENQRKTRDYYNTNGGGMVQGKKREGGK